MTEIDTKKEIAKYQAEFDNFIRQLQQLDQQRQQLVQAIQERQGIIAYLANLDGTKEKK